MHGHQTRNEVLGLWAWGYSQNCSSRRASVTDLRVDTLYLTGRRAVSVDDLQIEHSLGVSVDVLSRLSRKTVVLTLIVILDPDA